MADLSQDPVILDNPPCTRVGVDNFGPFEVKRGISLVNRYGVIFTCLAIHAVLHQTGFIIGHRLMHKCNISFHSMERVSKRDLFG